MTPEQMTDAVWKLALEKYEKKEALLADPAILHRVERDIMLQIVDAQWKDHLYSLDHLKEGIGLRGYGQRDPLVEYKKESFALFTAMKDRIEEEIVRYLWRLMPVVGEEGPGGRRSARPAPRAAPPPMTLSGRRRGRAPRRSARSAAAERRDGRRRAAAARRAPAATTPSGRSSARSRRSAATIPCPCGSGKKYKKCHGAERGMDR